MAIRLKGAHYEGLPNMQQPWPPAPASLTAEPQATPWTLRQIAVIMVCFLSAAFFALSALSAPSLKTPKYGNATTLPPLRFREDGTFQLSIFEDLHFGENAWETWGPQQDINSVKVMNEVLDAELSTQLVVLNGDLITGENAYLHNATLKIDQIVEPLVSRGLTWASTYGNHDSSFNLSREAILEREHLHPGVRTAQMVWNADAGVTNYYLPVYPYNSTGEPSLILWFFDSRGGFLYQQRNASGSLVGQPDWVDISVVNWYQETNAILRQKYQKVIPSLAFVHIPTNASQALQTEAGVDPHHQPGINDDYILAQQAQGWCEDGRNDAECVYGAQDVPFMRALATMPGLIAVFSGHDHGDTWCYKWDQLLPGMTVEGNGINLCFGQVNRRSRIDLNISR